MQDKKMLGAGLSFLGSGIIFTTIGFSGQPNFIGVGFAFIGLAMGFIAKSRKA